LNPLMVQASNVRAGLIDCDIHPLSGRAEDITQFLPERWQEHGRAYGSHMRSVYSNTITHPRMTPYTARLDAWSPRGGLPGSDVEFMREQLLDRFNIAYGILQPLRPAAASQRNIDFGSALCRAMNDWQFEILLPRDCRLRASIVVHPEDPVAAIAEIERCAGRRGFVQVSLPPRGLEPLGRRRYLSILEAAAAHGMTVGQHVSGIGVHAPTAGGWP
jgi:uncharacterized protein